MASMSDQYTQVGSDESGLVPPQNADRSEWPKRLRALTADELDRLTIDRDGRFFWDGKAVNGPGKPPVATTAAAADKKSSGDLEREAIDMLDRAAADIGAHHPAEQDAAPSEQPRESDATAIGPIKPGTEVAPITEQRSIQLVKPRQFASRMTGPEKVRLSLSPWQSLAMVVATIALFAGAFGIAVNGFVAANDWGCRVGWIKTYCPPKPVLHPGMSARIAD